MELEIVQVDAFTKHVFGGNSAAVVILERWLSDEVLQKIALENNLSETVFLVRESSLQDAGWLIRWF
ncbi:MAG: PhzF family phenazine biosynthesis protein, partial [Pseudomonadales bacterium]|nr:PhzF family phenazine biosynthesis protein [Pseudomonadales bacterium]